MRLLVAFVLTGVIMARFIEKRRYRVAQVCHSVAFVILLLYYSFYPGFAGGALWARVLGEDNVSLVRSVLFETGLGGSVMCVLLPLDIAVTLQSAAVLAAAARAVASHAAHPLCASASSKAFLRGSAALVHRTCPAAEPKRFLTLCRCNC